MASRQLKVFLCHSSGDKPAVRDLYKRLQADGFDPWLDEEDLLPGQDWEQEIPQAVRASDAILVCLSQSSITKEGYVQKEIAVALDVAEEKPEGVIFLIPLKLEECELPVRLRRWHAATLHEERGYEKLKRSLSARVGHLGMAMSSDAALVQPLSLSKPESSFKNSIGMEFILIPAGEFCMGSLDGKEDEKPVHRVRITRSFYLAKYPTAQAQWEAVMGNNPSRFKGDLTRPVENVSWEDAQEFLRRLSEREKRSYRLPTEAEWEYAARAGTTTAYCFGDDPRLLREYGWYEANSGGRTRAVGQLEANAWGLHDMHGNVWEWVQDWCAESYYQQSGIIDPQGPETEEYRVVRGGSWFDVAGGLRVSARRRLGPGGCDVSIGFRCVG